MSLFPTWKENKFGTIIISSIGVSLILLLSAQTINTLRESVQIGKPAPAENFITVDGNGSIKTTPDVASVELHIETRDDNSEIAQDQNTDIVNNLLIDLERLGIDETDLKTEYYSLDEDTRWSYDKEEWIHNGWICEQSLSITVRDIDLVGEVMALAGHSEVTDVYGPYFEIDDIEIYRDDARELAVADAKKRAKAIADALDLKLDAVIDYSEYMQNESDMYPVFSGRMMDTVSEEKMAMPEIRSGSEEVQMGVSITYRLSK